MTLDTTDPEAKVSAWSLSDDTGASSSDFITSTEEAQTISGTYTGSIGDNETLRVSLDNGINWIDASTAPGNQWTLTGQTITTNTLHAAVFDSAGNQSAVAKQEVTLDTTDPTVDIKAVIDNSFSDVNSNQITVNFNENIYKGSDGTIRVSVTYAPRLGGASDGTHKWDQTVEYNHDSTKINWNGEKTIEIDTDFSKVVGKFAEAQALYTVMIKNGAVIDAAGNKLADTAFTTHYAYNNVNADSHIDETIVVFDMVNGVSSSHSDRIFDRNVDYTIYVRVAEESYVMNDEPKGDDDRVNTEADYGKWKGADNLGEGDKIFFVTETGTITGERGGRAVIRPSTYHRTTLKDYTHVYFNKKIQDGEYLIKTDIGGWALKWNDGNSGFLRSNRGLSSNKGMWSSGLNLIYDSWGSDDIQVKIMTDYSAVLISQGLA